VETDTAAKFDRAVLGATVLEQTAALFQRLAAISEYGISDGRFQNELAQDAGRLYEVAGKHLYAIRTVGQLQSVVVRGHGDIGTFESPWVEFYQDGDGWEHARDAEPCQAAWRAALAGPVWPGVRTLAEVLGACESDEDGEGEEPETAEQRVVRLLREAMEARQRWTVTVEELAEVTEWEGGPSSLGREIERLAVMAGFLTRRPVTASGRPRLHPRTRRALVQIEAPAAGPGYAGQGAHQLALPPSNPSERWPDLRK
jgi:hypothetical protein